MSAYDLFTTAGLPLTWLVTAVLQLSGTSCSGTPPMKSGAWAWAVSQLPSSIERNPSA